jgi:hypothetical protein
MLSEAFQSGKAVLDHTDLVGIRNMSGKVNRRAMDAAASSAEGTPGSEAEAPPSSKKTKGEVIVKHKHEGGPRETPISAAIKALRGLIGTLREIGDEESLEQVPHLLKQLRDLEFRQVVDLVGAVATAAVAQV